MRTRTRVDKPNTYGTVVTSGTWPGTQTVLTAYDVSTMTDSNASGFYSRRKKGEMVNNPCEYTRTALESIGSGNFYSTTSDHSLWVSKSGPITSSFIENYRLSYVSVGVDVSSLFAKAANAALANIDKTPLAMGEDVAELRETLRFLRSPLSSMVKELRSIKRSPGKSLYYTLSAGWLTYRFAFSPLVRSIHDILSEYSSPTPKPPEIRISHGRASKDSRAQGITTLQLGGGNLDFAYSAARSVRVHSFVQYRVRSSTPAWQWRYGLRTKDIPITFWAVLPLSFMIDRVFDVSRLVESCTNMLDPSIEILGGGTSTHDDEYNTLQFVKEHSPPGWSSFGSGEVCAKHTHKFSRTNSVPSVSIPPLTPKGLVQDITNTLDLITILGNMLKR